MSAAGDPPAAAGVETTVPELVRGVRREVGRVLVGQERLVDRMLIGLLADGHVLLEGLPGLAKSLAVSTLARCLDLAHQRIQFTPDLLPADLLGTQVLLPDRSGFQRRKGPVFTQILLADEINRAPPKVQSALLEAMQERQVTLGEESLPLPCPFLVLATQNPIEQFGTFPLPEAELDRFLLKVRVGYPSLEQETEVLRRHGGGAEPAAVTPVADAAAVLAARQEADRLHVDPRIHAYVLALVHATRAPAATGAGALAGMIRFGASPRGSLALLRAARAGAWMAGRDHVVPQDVRDVAVEALAHRLVLDDEAAIQERTAESLVEELLQVVDVP